MPEPGPRLGRRQAGHIGAAEANFYDFNNRAAYFCRKMSAIVLKGT
jgi:hypothetical protein